MTSEVPGPNRATLDAMVAFLRSKLVKTSQFSSGEVFRALSETAERFNETSWFWTDDNAKAAELLGEPATYDADPATADAVIDFIVRMSPGAVIQRRCGPAELRVVSADPAAFRVETAFFILQGDLTRGIVGHALRFNDGRTVTASEHTGNYVVYRSLGRTITLDVEDTISATAVEVGDRDVSLSFTSTLRHRRLLAPTRPGRILGALTYRYTVSADQPSVALTVTLAPARRTTLRGVIVTASLNLNLAMGGHYRAVRLRAGSQDRLIRDVGDGRVVLHSAAAEYAAVYQEGGAPGFAYGMHLLFRDGGKLETVVARGQTQGRLNAILVRYGFQVVKEPVVIREARMLTGGGYYDAVDHYVATIRDGVGGGEADPSMSYDVGAELNAVAVHLLFARRGCYGLPPAAGRLDALTAWYDLHIDRYFAGLGAAPGDTTRVFTRGIAFVVLSLDCMLRATGQARYRALLDSGVRLIQALATRESLGHDHRTTFGDAWDQHVPFLDCQAACILALARAAWHGDPDGAIGQAVREGILGLRLYSGVIDLGGGTMESYDGLAVVGVRDGREHADSAFWAFKLGLVLRALHAAGHAAEAGIIAMDEQDRRRCRLRLQLAEDLIAQCCRRHGEMLEVLTSRLAGETNSETQPWAGLGLVPLLDEEITALEVSGINAMVEGA